MDVQPTYIEITSNPIRLDEWIEKITLPSTGAICSFTGVVRAYSGIEGFPEETQYLEYEAYIPMAEIKMGQIAAEIRARWSTVIGIVIVQRIGRLYPETPTVLIACSSAHRDTGVFEAARYGIDRLKEIVPVWKKEVTLKDETWIEGSYRPDESDKKDVLHDS